MSGRSLRWALVVGLAPWMIGLARAESPVVVKGPEGVTISVADLSKELENAPPEARQNILSSPVNLHQLATNLYLRRYFAAQATKLGLENDPAVQDKLAWAREQVLSEAAAVKLDGGVPDDAALEKLAATEFRVHGDKYMTDEEISVRHILIGKDKADAAKQAEALLAKLKAGGDFAALAQELSDDPGSKAKGGDLGYFARGRMVPSFEKAAFALKNPGDLSPVVETEFGFHILRLDGRKAPQAKPYAAVKEAIKKEQGAAVMKDHRSVTIEKALKGTEVDQKAVEEMVRAARTK